MLGSMETFDNGLGPYLSNPLVEHPSLSAALSPSAVCARTGEEASHDSPESLLQLWAAAKFTGVYEMLVVTLVLHSRNEFQTVHPKPFDYLSNLTEFLTSRFLLLHVLLGDTGY